MSLDQIKIVLVETSHPGNIGSAARAMKTMGLSQLYLVSPKVLPNEESIALSAGSADVVENAHIVSSFDEAVADCSLIIGTSARARHLSTTAITPRHCGEKAIAHLHTGKVAIVFGRERIGLTNEELLKCHYHLNIPANPEYSSLNLAMAVQLVSYEIRMAYLQAQLPEGVEPAKVTAAEGVVAEELEYFFQKTEKVYQELGFIQNSAVMKKLRRLYLRTAIQRNELNILQGMLTAVERLITKDRN
ncbi:MULTISPECIES: tRNA (cytosine(32)/uridine(32)-2'-O)-methyltransferase TrmJ [Gallibacterium]|uniref:tRNA (cytidine/uridine-2'-O-)-methyltransferase TrmJ n=1 Tax=Gallibacterium genomosp. 3 TaxID=505345 RepID=A0A1A7NUX2_9PAST|nr:MULTISPECIES: tRNA (cytosine(32)/uridine(32)-2'-O)-methyltransferase TrmJ [Gallibacterium]MDA3979472.1 tRNA (cytosine(32)/uridine(32)-2'-O)-methyltransferase TrmJ [Gallibacterium sp. AGMB14963]OBW93296.1 tRNA (cytidine/uridine-2'-O-)-methyltransferase [Gallibacterium genomosp. 3]